MTPIECDGRAARFMSRSRMLPYRLAGFAEVERQQFHVGTRVSVATIRCPQQEDAKR
jgi:hypothetical protein